MAGLRRVSLTDQATEAIVDLIVTDGLQPGQALPSSFELAERFDVSRTVIREALADLAGRGAVKRTGGRETVVAVPGAPQLSDVLGHRMRTDNVTAASLIEFRRIVEVSGAELAATRASDTHLAELTDVLERMRSALASPAAYNAADVEFHRLVAEATGNLLLQLTVESVATLLANFRAQSFTEATRRRRGPEQSLAEHEAILDALQRRDPAAAAAAMSAHLDAVAALLTGTTTRKASASA